MVRAGLGFLAHADATAMAAEEQARCLQALERAGAIGTAARASILGAFTAGRGYAADADYSPRAWLTAAGLPGRCGCDLGHRGAGRRRDAVNQTPRSETTDR
jgi:hypothetical protein